MNSILVSVNYLRYGRASPGRLVSDLSREIDACGRPEPVWLSVLLDLRDKPWWERIQVGIITNGYHSMRIAYEMTLYWLL
jgi:hypothetical protein